MSEFDCNICLDSAKDPVVTLCGHLHCWACLYKWLNIHSQSHECPVCKALIEQEKLIPLYGRGKTTTDPRSKPVLGCEIPSRPRGRRPQTALPREANDFYSAVFGRMGSDFGFSPILGFRFHGFSRYSYGYSGLFDDGEGGESRVISEDHVQGNDTNLKKIHLFIFVFVIFALLTL